MILSIDTTGAVGSIALCEGEVVIEEARVEAPEGFGQVLFARIGELLQRTGVGMAGIECFAVAAGPGSFTGVRVGLTAVKGFAEAMGKPVVAVSNLRAVAFFGGASLRGAISDARRGQVYAGVYDAGLRLQGEEIVTGLREWLERPPPEGIEFVTQNLALLGGLPGTLAPWNLAGAIGRIAWREFSEGRAREAEEIDANYVRRTDAEMKWKD